MTSRKQIVANRRKAARHDLTAKTAVECELVFRSVTPNPMTGPLFMEPQSGKKRTFQNWANVASGPEWPFVMI